MFSSLVSLCLKYYIAKVTFENKAIDFSFSHQWHFFRWYQILFLEKLLQWMVITPPAVTAGKIILEAWLFVIFQKKVLKALDFRNDYDELYWYQGDSPVFWQLLFVFKSNRPIGLTHCVPSSNPVLFLVISISFKHECYIIMQN